MADREAQRRIEDPSRCACEHQQPGTRALPCVQRPAALGLPIMEDNTRSLAELSTIAHAHLHLLLPHGFGSFLSADLFDDKIREVPTHDRHRSVNQTRPIYSNYHSGTCGIRGPL